MNTPVAGSFRDVRALALTAGLCLFAASGCASTTYAHQSGDNRVQGAFEQPLRDVSVMRENPPDILIHAAEAPYALPGDGGCSVILDEIAALDLVLGADLDAPDRPPPRSSTDISALVSDAVGGVIGLPYRSIVRRLSGAESRERALRDAVFAGMVRRAFLKGVALAECTTPPPPASPDPAVGDAPVTAASTAQPNAPDLSVPQPNGQEPSMPQPVTSEPGFSQN